jgi:flagellar biosynthesis protein FlhF
MNIRRFVAPDMREALSAIRADLGADAVMLSSRKLPNGVEVIAAIDYDDSLFPAQRPAEQAAAPRSRQDVADDDGDDEPRGERDGELDDDLDLDAEDGDELDFASVLGGADGGTDELEDYERAAAAVRLAAVKRATQRPAAEDVSAPSAPKAAPFTAPSFVPAPASEARSTTDHAVAGEIKDLRRLLETQLASLAWNDLNRDAPVRARLLREMAKFGVDAVLARQLAHEIPADLGSQEAMRALVRRFGERLPLAQWDMADEGGVFAVVGPTGVGKTTTIAKIAARFVLRHSVDQLGLVSTDTYRIGARQQLANFARILRAPMHVAEGPEELRRVLDGFANKKLVLIDTAGMSQRDVRLASQFETLRVDGHRVRTVLALSAGADRGCLAEALNVFQRANPEALIVTKLDEAAALGGVLSLAIRAALPIAYLSDGQRVPEDLHLAAPKRFWLMHNAVKLTQSAAVSPDENELEASFGEMELSAHG